MKNAKFLSFIILIINIIILNGCISTYVVYEPLNEANEINSGKIAVISGYNNQYITKFSELVTDYLINNSRFSVITQKEISEVFPTYPANILDGSAEGFTDNDKGKMDNIQNGIGADYILVVWIDNMGTYSSSQMFTEAVSFVVHSRMISYPESKIIGYSEFEWEARRLFTSKEETIENMLDGSADTLVYELLTDTGMMN